jgi:hypothetical protein
MERAAEPRFFAAGLLPRDFPPIKISVGYMGLCAARHAALFVFFPRKTVRFKSDDDIEE